MDLFSLPQGTLLVSTKSRKQVFARTMMNALNEPKSLPATEALNVSISTQMIPERELRKAQLVTPQSSNDSLESSTAPQRKKRSFDMADLLTATEPVEQAIAFPTIEWCRDGDDDEEDESENDANDLYAIQPLTGNHDDRWWLLSILFLRLWSWKAKSTWIQSLRTIQVTQDFSLLASRRIGAYIWRRLLETRRFLASVLIGYIRSPRRTTSTQASKEPQVVTTGPSHEHIGTFGRLINTWTLALSLLTVQNEDNCSNNAM